MGWPKKKHLDLFWMVLVGDLGLVLDRMVGRWMGSEHLGPCWEGGGRVSVGTVVGGRGWGWRIRVLGSGRWSRSG